MPSRRTFVLTSVLVSVSCFGLGCSGGSATPTTVSVTGEVLYNGKPVDGAEVAFVSKSEAIKSARGTTDANGKFVLKTYVDPTKEVTGAMEGDYDVSISKVEQKVMTPEEMSKLSQSGQMIPPPKSLIPAKYSEITSSGIKATVKSGEVNDFKYELSD